MAEENSYSFGDSQIPSSSTVSEVDVNPNQRLSSILLNEFNYLPWSRAVSLALGGRSKLGFINGSIEVPDVSSPNYEIWLCKDQLVMSWLLNSMERKLAEIFSYSESSFKLWQTVKEMYGSQNNAACVFQLKKNISNIQQEGKPFVQLLGSMKSMWNELEMYRPHTTEASSLLKRAEEDKIFQLLSSLDSGYEDLRSHILMNPELPSFTSVCATIQREEVRRKVMNTGTKTSVTEAMAYLANERKYKVKNPHLKCQHCNYTGHVKETCWILHPELKLEFMKDNKGSQRLNRAVLLPIDSTASIQHGKLYVQTAQQAYSTASMGKGKTARVCTLERNVHVIADSWTAGKGMCMCMCAVASDYKGVKLSAFFVHGQQGKECACACVLLHPITSV